MPLCRSPSCDLGKTVRGCGSYLLPMFSTVAWDQTTDITKPFAHRRSFPPTPSYPWKRVDSKVMTTTPRRSKHLLVDDVLSHIFSYADRGSNAICARVCKQWASHALNEVWKDLGQPGRTGTIEDLIQILSPLKVERTRVNYSETTKKVRVFPMRFSK